MADADKANLTQGQLKSLMHEVKNAGGGSGYTVLTKDDVNYATAWEGNDAIALWLLEPGDYEIRIENTDNGKRPMVCAGNVQYYSYGTSYPPDSVGVVRIPIDSTIYVHIRKSLFWVDNDDWSQLYYIWGDTCNSYGQSSFGYNCYKALNREGAGGSTVRIEGLIANIVPTQDEFNNNLFGTYFMAAAPKSSLMANTYAPNVIYDGGNTGLVNSPGGDAAYKAARVLCANGAWRPFAQSDWNQSNNSEWGYVQNKPFYTEYNNTDSGYSLNRLQILGPGKDTAMDAVPNYHNYGTIGAGDLQSQDMTASKYNDLMSKAANGDAMMFKDIAYTIEDFMAGTSTVVTDTYTEPAVMTQGTDDNGDTFYYAETTIHFTVNNNNNAYSAVVFLGNIPVEGGGYNERRKAVCVTITEPNTIDNNPWNTSGFTSWFGSRSSQEIVHQLDSKYIKLDPNVFEINNNGEITLKSP